MKEDNIVNALRNKRVIRFHYHRYDRVVEPHILGVNNGVTQLLGYQIRGGSTSGRVPEWRRFDLSEMDTVTVTEQTFTGSRTIKGWKHTKWDHIIERV